MPVVDIAHQHMLTARALHEAQKVAGTQSFASLDWSALVAGPRVAAGLDGLDSSKASENLRKDQTRCSQLPLNPQHTKVEKAE